MVKLATLKSNWEALDWESKVTVCICAMLLIIIKARGTKRAKALRREKRF